jgi:hypothetical protein
MHDTLRAGTELASSFADIDQCQRKFYTGWVFKGAQLKTVFRGS